KVKRTLVQALSSAIEQFAGLIRDTGGSHTKLQHRLEATRTLSDAAQSPAQRQFELGARRRIFLANAAWLGSRMDTQSVTTFVRSVPDQPGLIEGATLNAFLGRRARLAAFPLVMGVMHRSMSASEENGAASKSDGTLLPEFCSSSLHTLSARDTNE